MSRRVDDGATMGWHTTSTSASGLAHFWRTADGALRRSVCGRTAVVADLRAATQSLGQCRNCAKGLGAGDAMVRHLDGQQPVEMLRAGHELRNRNKGWWLTPPIDEHQVREMEEAGILKIDLLTSSLSATLA